MITRRILLCTGSAALAVAALPIPTIATTATATSATIAPVLTAEMFWTEDEPWGAFVRGHVSKEQFDAAMIDMIEGDCMLAENAEDWLCTTETIWTDDEEDYEEKIKIIADPEHTYIRPTISADEDSSWPEERETWRRCKADAPGAVPITVVMY